MPCSDSAAGKVAFSILLLSLLYILAAQQIAQAHSAFYPHHLQDFGMIRSREEVRLTVLITTVIFLLLLGGVIILALKKGQLEAESHQQDAAKRLHTGVAAAADALESKWRDSPAEALQAALAAYADVVGVRWNPALQPHCDLPIRCQLGGDVFSIERHQHGAKSLIVLRASYREHRASALIDADGTIQYEPSLG